MTDSELSVRRMQQYIRDHIHETISMKELAAAALFSPVYARKLFIRTLHMSPAVYIRRLRLTESALMLRDGSKHVLDAAMDYGFGSVDGYQRAFRREFGCNPGEYARSPVPLWLFTPYLITDRERKETTMSDVRNVFIQIVEKPARKAVIKRGIKGDDYFSYCNEVGCDVWGLLKSIPSPEGEPEGLFLPVAMRKPASNSYVQGIDVEASYFGPVPDGFELIDLPEATYLLFRGEPFEDEDYENAIREIWRAEERYDPGFIGYEWDESNPRIQLEPIGSRGYIELVPVRKK